LSLKKVPDVGKVERGSVAGGAPRKKFTCVGGGGKNLQIKKKTMAHGKSSVPGKNPKKRGGI